MPLVVIYDANVLYPSTLQDLLIRVAQAPWHSLRRVHPPTAQRPASIRRRIVVRVIPAKSHTGSRAAGAAFSGFFTGSDGTAQESHQGLGRRTGHGGTP